MKLQCITLPELKKYFGPDTEIALHSGIRMQLEENLSITAKLWDKKPVAFNLQLILEEDDPQFAEKLNLVSFRQLEATDMDYLWEQYEKGHGEVTAVMYDLFDMEIVFQQKEGKTYITRHCNDEKLIEVLEETSRNIDWFRAYIRDYAKRWYEMAEGKGGRNVCIIN